MSNVSIKELNMNVMVVKQKHALNSTVPAYIGAHIEIIFSTTGFNLVRSIQLPVAVYNNNAQGKVQKNLN